MDNGRFTTTMPTRLNCQRDSRRQLRRVGVVGVTWPLFYNL